MGRWRPSLVHEIEGTPDGPLAEIRIVLSDCLFIWASTAHCGCSLDVAWTGFCQINPISYWQRLSLVSIQCLGCFIRTKHSKGETQVVTAVKGTQKSALTIGLTSGWTRRDKMGIQIYSFLLKPLCYLSWVTYIVMSAVAACCFVLVVTGQFLLSVSAQ